MTTSTPVSVENFEDLQYLADSINSLEQTVFIGVVFISFLFLFFILRS